MLFAVLLLTESAAGILCALGIIEKILGLSSYLSFVGAVFLFNFAGL